MESKERVSLKSMADQIAEYLRGRGNLTVREVAHGLGLPSGGGLGFAFAALVAGGRVTRETHTCSMCGSQVIKYGFIR